MAVGLLGPANRWLPCAAVALLLLLAACAEVQPAGGQECSTSSECGSGVCQDGSCVSAQDVAEDPVLDPVPDTPRSIDPIEERQRDPLPVDVEQGPTCLEYPEPCTDDEECCSDFCIDSDEGRVCTERCLDDDDCSGEGWLCRLLNGSEPDVVRLCVPPRDFLCEPCSNDSQCGGLADFCVEQEDGTFCASDCELTRDCPGGFVCNPLTIVGAGPDGEDLDVWQCEPEASVCGDEPVCEDGFANCDGNPGTGCDTNLNDPATCGTACASIVDCDDSDACTAETCTDGVCGNPSICEGTAASCGCDTCVDCSADDGWYDVGEAYACCDGLSACATCQDQEYRTHACGEEGCTFTVTDTQTVTSDCTTCVDEDACSDDQCADGVCSNLPFCAGSDTACGCDSCADCTALDGWYDDGESYACCEGDSTCDCQDQEYRTHTCSGTECTYEVTGTQTLREGCSACTDFNDCTQDRCAGGACTYPEICRGDAASCGCDSCTDCTANDGWYQVGSAYSCCASTSTCSCQDRELRTYSCAGTSCSYTAVAGDTVVSGCTDCADASACTTDVCTGAGQCVNDTICGGTNTSCGCTSCTNCTSLSGWYNVGGGYACCSGSQRCSSCQDQQYRSYVCSGTSCAYSVTNTRTNRSGCSSCNDGNSCTQNTCVSGSCSYPGYCSGTSTSCGCTGCTNCSALPRVNSTSCSGTSCVINSCDGGYAHCDTSTTNGCERTLSGHSNSAPGEGLGSYDADRNEDLLLGCPAQTCQLKQTRSGTRGRWFNVTAREGSNCCAYLAMTFELAVPSGVNFDLHVSGACSCVWWNGSSWINGCSATRGTGGDEILVAWCPDNCDGGDDDFTANIEVRYASGASCDSWVLETYARDCYP